VAAEAGGYVLDPSHVVHTSPGLKEGSRNGKPYNCHLTNESGLEMQSRLRKDQKRKLGLETLGWHCVGGGGFLLGGNSFLGGEVGDRTYFLRVRGMHVVLEVEFVAELLKSLVLIPLTAKPPAVLAVLTAVRK